MFGLIIMLLALLVLLGFFLSQMALIERPLRREFVPLSGDLLTGLDEPVDVEKVADLLQASLDGVLTDGDPRTTIRVAYGTLLDGLAEIGLSRRPEEGPDEHMERCLKAAELPPAPIRELLRLFALARFSTHPITEDHPRPGGRRARRRDHQRPPPRGRGMRVLDRHRRGSAHRDRHRQPTASRDVRATCC